MDMIRVRGYVSQGRSRLSRSRFSVEAQRAADGIMKRLVDQVTFSGERKWLRLSLLVTSVISFLLLVNLGLGFLGRHPFLPHEIEPRARARSLDGVLLPSPPKLAYLITGTEGDGVRMQRTLQALYHPHNYYLLQLDRAAPARERVELARFVKNQPVFEAVNNVFVVAKANLVTYRGPTMIAATLHGAAILLRKAQDWDWFINLSASDYPLITQDDLLHVFSYLPKDLNFLEHTSDMGWKEFERAKPIIIDPGLFQKEKTDIVWATEQRALPTAFRLFTGSAWTVLTRSFIEFCNLGYDNLPRTMLMYYANFVSSPEGYFQTVICNSPEFRNTTVNHDLHFISWDYPPKQHPLTLTLDFYHDMVTSGAAFARKFDPDDPVLQKIDDEILHRRRGKFAPGAWCVGGGEDPCSVTGDATLLSPGPGARRLEELVVSLLSPEHFRSHQCVGA